MSNGKSSPLKIACCLIAACCLSQVRAQERTVYSGYYVDSFSYRPAQRDTFRFERYPNGTFRVLEDRQYIWITDLTDIPKERINYTVQVDKFSRAPEYDSFKTVYHYRGDRHVRSTHFQKIAFKQSGGCFVYDNRRSSYWIQTGYSTLAYDPAGAWIRQTDYEDFDSRRDTARHFSSFLFDSRRRMTEQRSYREDTLYRFFRYSYGPGTQKTQTFKANGGLIQSIEEFTTGDRLMKTIEYHRYGSGGTVEKLLFYNQAGSVHREESYNIRPDARSLFLVRHYYYD